MDRSEAGGADPAPAARPTGTERAHETPHVLVVDDDEKNLRALAALLSEVPCRVLLARSGAEALRVLMRQDVAVVLLDVQMPGMDGLEVAELIRSRDRSRRTPIIFLTAFARSDAQLRKAYRLGAVDFLTKPIEPAEILRDKVAWFVDSRRAALLLEAERERARAAERRERDRAVENAKRLGEAAALRSEMERQGELLSRVNRSNARLRMLSSVANELLVQTSTLGALPRVFEGLSSQLGLEVHLLHLVDPDGTLALRSHAGAAEHVLHQVARLPPESLVFARAAAQRAPVVVADVAHSEEPLPALRLLELTCSATYPLLAYGRLIGTLTFASRQRAAFDPEDLSALEITADQIAMALDRDRLIGELWQRAEDLASADRRKDEFLAMLAHELRNPLAPILNAVEILGQDEASPAAARRALRAADRQVRHLARLVGDLVDVSRIRTGKVELRRGPVDLRKVVEDAVAAVEALAHEKRQTLSVQVPDAVPPIDGDAVRVTQIVENLLHNAVKYTEEGGRISLDVEPLGVEIAIRVRDDGIGIPPDLLPRIFDIFVQGHQSPSRAQGGLGLGLALVKSLVELHDGSVTAVSDGPGRGSTFEVRLPALPHAPRAHREDGPARHEPPASPAPSLRVAVIEDNKDIRDTLRELLRLRGHEVVEAEDGPGGVQLVLTREPDVALVDIGLPGLDGYEVAARLRGAAGRTRLVALTGYGGEEDRKRATRAGFDAHLVKPVDFQDLSRLLDRLAAGEARGYLEGAAPCPT
jgi:signal transduction histidine kinase/DNA-binding response OmpR family regulator